MIEIRDVVKSYGNVTVVDHVSLKFPEGKITSFIGPNGAGRALCCPLLVV